MSAVQITNNIVYTVPDSDSESEDDYCLTVFSPASLYISEKQEKNLINLGCIYNPLEEQKRMHSLQNPNGYDQQFALSMQQHQQRLRKENETLIQQQRQLQEAELKKMKDSLSQITLSETKDDADDDKAFEEELKKQRKLIDDAIALDKKRSETASAEAKAKAEKEKKEKEEKEQKAKELEKQKEQKKQELEELKKKKQSTATSIDGLAEYQKYYKKIEHYKTNIKPKLKDDAFRKQCFNFKRTINRTVSQLQSDHTVVVEKYNVMNNLLSTVKSQSQEAFEVMLNHLAKVFLAQVKQEVHATAFAAYFLARFAYLVCSTVPEFLDYLMGRLLKRCPYLIPQYHDDDPTLSQDEIRLKLRYGYTNKEKKIFETFLEHAEKQKCFVMFYGALCQTIPDPGQPANPFPIKHAWIWLARICNMPPREITPVLVHSLLEVSANRLLEAYPNQSPKLFRLIREICPMYPVLDSRDNVASITRLEMFLDDYFRTGRPECVPEVPPPSV